MKVIIYDINKDLINTCKERFKNTKVECTETPFEDIKADYVVTAGNSFGIMGGGIDLAVKRHLGSNIEVRVQNKIKLYHNGQLPVGELIDEPFYVGEDSQILLYCPTMISPGTMIDKGTVHLVACAIFNYMLDKNDKSVAICGLGTLTGRVSFGDFADAVYEAYIEIVGDDNE